MAQNSGGLDLGAAEIKVVIDYTDAIKGVEAFKSRFNDLLKDLGSGVFDYSVAQSAKAGRTAGQNFAKSFSNAAKQAAKGGALSVLGGSLGAAGAQSAKDTFDSKSLKDLLNTIPQTRGQLLALISALQAKRNELKLGSQELYETNRQIELLGEASKNTAKSVFTLVEEEKKYREATARAAEAQERRQQAAEKAAKKLEEEQKLLNRVNRAYAEYAKVRRIGRAFEGAVSDGFSRQGKVAGGILGAFNGVRNNAPDLAQAGVDGLSNIFTSAINAGSRGAKDINAFRSGDLKYFQREAEAVLTRIRNATVDTKVVVRGLIDTFTSLAVTDLGSKGIGAGLTGLKGIVEKIASDIQAIQGISFKGPFGQVQEPAKDFLAGSLSGLQGFAQGLGGTINDVGALSSAIDQAGNLLAGLGPEGAATAAAVTAAVFAMDSAVRGSFQKGLKESEQALRDIDRAAQELLETLSKLGSARPVAGLRDALGKAVAAQNQTAPGSPENVDATQRVVELNKELERSLSIQNALQERLSLNDRDRAKFLRDLVVLSELGARPIQKPQLLLPDTDLLQNQAFRDGRSSQGNFPFRRIEAGQTVSFGVDPRSFADLGDLRTRTNDPRTKRAQQEALKANEKATDEMVSFMNSFGTLVKVIGDAASESARRLRSTESAVLGRLKEFSAEIDSSFKQSQKERDERIEAQKAERRRLAEEAALRDIEEVDREEKDRTRRRDGVRKRLGAAAQGGLIGGGFPLLFGQGFTPALGGGVGGVLGGLVAGQGGSFAGSIVGSAIGTGLDALATSANEAAVALQRPVEALNKLVEGKLITGGVANLASTVAGQGQQALAREIIAQGLRDTGAENLRDPRKAQEVRDRAFLETQNQQALQKTFGGFDLGKAFQTAVAFYTGVRDDVRANFAVETRTTDGELLTTPNIRPRANISGPGIVRLKNEAIEAGLITKEDYQRFIDEQEKEGNVVNIPLLGQRAAPKRAADFTDAFIARLTSINPNFAELLPSLSDQVIGGKESIARQEDLQKLLKDIQEADKDLAPVSGKNLEEEIRLLDKKLTATNKLNKANREAIDNSVQRDAQAAKDQAAEAQAQRRINDLRAKSIQQDVAFSNNLSALSRQRVDLLAAQGKEDPSSFLQTQGVLNQFRSLQDQASLASQISQADPENVEASRRATEASEALKNGYLEANLTLKKGLEDAQRQARKIGFALTDALDGLATAQQGFTDLGRLRTISVSGGPNIFEALRGKQDVAKQIAKDTGTKVNFDVPISGRINPLFAKRQIRDIDKFISAARPLRDARAGVEDAARNKRVSDETVQNFQTAIASLNNEATPAMQKLASSVDNLAQKEWRIDIAVEGQPRVIREGVY